MPGPGQSQRPGWLLGFAILKGEAGATYSPEHWVLCTTEESLLTVGMEVVSVQR